MAEYEINLNSDQVKGLLTSDDGLKGLVESVVNQVLDSQMSEHLTAAPYERSRERKGYRNGYRSRSIYARIAAVTALGSGQNFHIKRAQLLCFSRINAFTEIADMNHLRRVGRGAEFAVKCPVICTLRQLSAPFPLQVFFDITAHGFKQSGCFYFRVAQVKCFFHQSSQQIFQTHAHGMAVICSRHYPDKCCRIASNG